MHRTKSIWYFLGFVLMVIIDISLNEIGLGVVSLILLLPTCWLMSKSIEKEKTNDQ